MSNKGKLFLIPSVISENTHDTVIGTHILSQLPGIRYFLAEDIRTARRFLSSLKVYDSIEALSFSVLDKDTPQTALSELLKPVFDGNDIGILSESGCPGIADPGAIAVSYAHQRGIKVVPLVGPSSILLALMASGLNGQQFAFHGYLPVDATAVSKKVKDLEKESATKNQTQIFIETPYRNNAMLSHLLKYLKNETSLCIATDLTGSFENVVTKSVGEWRLSVPELPKQPTVFLFLA